MATEPQSRPKHSIAIFTGLKMHQTPAVLSTLGEASLHNSGWSVDHQAQASLEEDQAEDVVLDKPLAGLVLAEVEGLRIGKRVRLIVDLHAGTR